MKKNILKILSTVVFIASIFTFFAPKVTLAESQSQTSEINRSFVSLDSLSDEQKEAIIYGNPEFQASHDQENVILIYKPITTVDTQEKTMPTQLNDTPTSPIASKTKKTASLPQTGDTLGNKTMIVVGITLLVGFCYLLIWKRKKMKHFLVVLLLGGVFGNFSVVQAEMVHLISPTKETVAKGTSYVSDIPVIPGYDYVGYLYSTYDEPKEEIGTVIVYYQDTEGNQLALPESLTGPVGSSYTASEKSFGGYSLQSVTGNQTGVFTTDNQEVIFIYEKTPPVVGTVTVHYQDTKGNELASTEILSGPVGSTYTANGKIIDGYSLKSVIGNQTGVFTTDNQEVIFIYERNIIPEEPTSPE